MDTNKNVNPLDCITDWMEDLGDASLDDLRTIRREMGDDVEASETRFLAMLREQLSRLSTQEVLATASTLEEDRNDAKLAGILKAALKKGLSNAQLAALTGLTVVLITKLDRGLISLRRIPRVIIERLAEALGCSPQSLREYLQSGPRLAEDAFYKSADTPEVAEPQDFFEAVRTDPLLSEPQRQALLALEDEFQ